MGGDGAAGGCHVRGRGQRLSEVWRERQSRWAGGFGAAALEGRAVVGQMGKLGYGLPDLAPEAGAGDLEREI